jgi:DNA-binding HxlR family transcriptional regulator
MAHAQEETCTCCESGTAVEEDMASTEMTCYCPLDGVIDTVAKKYSMQVIALLGANGPTRFGHIEDTLGVTSSSTLTERLEELARADLIERRSFDEIPPRVEYSLTQRGRELEERIHPLLEWAAEQ